MVLGLADLFPPSFSVDLNILGVILMYLSVFHENNAIRLKNKLLNTISLTYRLALMNVHYSIPMGA